MSQPRTRVRATALMAALIGVCAAVVIVAHFKVGVVLAAMRPIGLGGFLAAIAAQLALFLPLGLAWQAVAPGEPLRKAPVFVWSRLVREAASDVLPFSQLGGFVVAGRAAVVGGISTATALASSLVDATVEILAQLVYTLIGLALLAHRLGFAARGHRLIYSLAGGVAIAAVLVAGMIIFQKRGLHLAEGLLHRLAPEAGRQAGGVAEAVARAYANPLRLSAGLGLHALAWFGAAGGSWLILTFIDRPLPFLSVVGLESLMFAIRNTVFIAPSGLGVQEGAYALIGPLFGLPPEAALALSLLKRGRDISIGVPMLLSWLGLEGRRGSARLDQRKAPRDGRGAAIVAARGGPRLNPGGSGDKVGDESPRKRLRS